MHDADHGRIGWVAATGWFGRHVGFVALGLVAVTAALVPGLARLEFSTSQDTMVDPATDVYRDNVRYQERFGGEVMVLLFEGSVTDLVTPEHRAEFDALEQGLARAGGYHTVVSPVEALEYAADQLEIASVLQPQAFERERQLAADEARAEAAADGADLAAQEAAAAAGERRPAAGLRGAGRVRRRQAGDGRRALPGQPGLRRLPALRRAGRGPPVAAGRIPRFPPRPDGRPPARKHLHRRTVRRRGDGGRACCRATLRRLHGDGHRIRSAPRRDQRPHAQRHRHDRVGGRGGDGGDPAPRYCGHAGGCSHSP